MFSTLFGLRDRVHLWNELSWTEMCQCGFLEAEWLRNRPLHLVGHV